MWPKAYRDYPKDTPLKKQQVSAGKGIVGCEMHEVNGWGEEFHRPKKRKGGLISSILHAIFRSTDKEGA